MDTSEDKSLMYFVSPKRGINKLCTRTDSVLLSKNLFQHGEQILGLISRKSGLYCYHQT